MRGKHSGGIAFAAEYHPAVTVIGSEKRRNHFVLLVWYSRGYIIPFLNIYTHLKDNAYKKLRERSDGSFLYAARRAEGSDLWYNGCEHRGLLILFCHIDDFKECIATDLFKMFIAG